MSIFGNILGSIAGPVVGGLLGNIGSNRARDQEQAAAQAAQAAAAPVSVFGPGGSSVYNAANNSLNLSVPGHYQRAANKSFGNAQTALRTYQQFQPAGYDVDAEVGRLRQLRAPDIAQARSQLQSQLLNRGRLGLGVGGGRTGGLFQPESAALEEAILGAQLSDIGSAQDRAMRREALDYDRQGQLLENARGLFNMSGGLQGGAQGAAQLGIQGRLPSGIAALQAGPGNNQASATRGFFSSLGSGVEDAVSGIDWGGIFGDPPPQQYPDYGGGPGDYQGQ